MERKPDYAHRMTDKELGELERRISAIYQEARNSLDETVRAYFESFRQRDEKMKKLIGTIQNGREWTKQDYNNWRLAQIGTRWRSGIQTPTRRLPPMSMMLHQVSTH